MTQRVRCFKIRYTEIQEREIILAGSSKADAEKCLSDVIVGGRTISKKIVIHEIARAE